MNRNGINHTSYPIHTERNVEYIGFDSPESDSQLLRISDCTKLTPEEFRAVIDIRTDRQIIRVLKKIITSTFPLEDLKSIHFDHLGDRVQQSLMGWMLTNKLSTDMICVLLDQMKSVNYGKYGWAPSGHIINPLLYCCCFNKFDLVKLLVERYGADIEHLSYNDTTAIMYSAYKCNVEITRYLYHHGARLSTSTHHINEFARTNSIREFITEWETDKKFTQTETKTMDPQVENESLKQCTVQDAKKPTYLDQIKADLMKLKLENVVMKQKYQTIQNLLQNNS